MSTAMRGSGDRGVCARASILARVLAVLGVVGVMLAGAAPAGATPADAVETRTQIMVLDERGTSWRRSAAGAQVFGVVELSLRDADTAAWSVESSPAGRGNTLVWDTTMLPDGRYRIGAVVDGRALDAVVDVVNNGRVSRARLSAPLVGEIGTGLAELTVVDTPTGPELCFELWSFVDEAPRAAHVQIGTVDERGPVFIDLRLPWHRVDTTTGGHHSRGCNRLSTGSADRLLADLGGFYVNLTTASRPTGALRGALSVAAAPMLAAPLAGSGAEGVVVFRTVGHGIICADVELRGAPIIGVDVGEHRLLVPGTATRVDGLGTATAVACAEVGPEAADQLLAEPAMHVVEAITTAGSLRGIPDYPRFALAPLSGPGGTGFFGQIIVFPDTICYRVSLGGTAEPTGARIEARADLSRGDVTLIDPGLSIDLDLVPSAIRSGPSSGFVDARRCVPIQPVAADQIAAVPAAHELVVDTIGWPAGAVSGGFG